MNEPVLSNNRLIVLVNRLKCEIKAASHISCLAYSFHSASIFPNQVWNTVKHFLSASKCLLEAVHFCRASEHLRRMHAVRYQLEYSVSKILNTATIGV